LHWGATVEEASTPLPGDDLVPEPAYVTTRTITVQAPAEAVWPWLVQLGQGRGGFYTYDRLEQMVGAGIRSADHIVPELQQLAIGDTVPLSPVGGPKVALLDPGRALVLSETMDLLRSLRALRAGQWSGSWSRQNPLIALPHRTSVGPGGVVQTRYLSPDLVDTRRRVRRGEAGLNKTYLGRLLPGSIVESDANSAIDGSPISANRDAKWRAWRHRKARQIADD